MAATPKAPKHRLLIALLGSLAVLPALGRAPATGAEAQAPADPAAVLETQHLRLVIGRDGYNAGFIDKRTGKDHDGKDGRMPFVFLSRGGKRVNPTACAAEGGTLAFAFPDGARVGLKVTAKPRWLVAEIASVTGEGIEEVAFGALRVPLNKHVSGMSGIATDGDFAACIRVLDLRSTLRLGGVPAHFEPAAPARYGLVGAKVALVGCPYDALGPLLRDLVREEGLPWSPLGGPFALEAEENRGSYVFATVSEKNADEWITLARRAGLAQIHMISWEQTLGHYQPRQDLFPSGLEGLKAVVAKIHAAGLRAGMHTLSGGIARNDPFVTPVPDKRLAKDAAFTLAADLGEAGAAVPLAEPPGDLETTWEYSGRCNIVQIEDELIQYTGLAKTAPFGLTGCTRGALGTKARPHAKGATVHHLFAIYSTFQPDENSTLVDEVAERIAAVFNTCGFDMIYMDGAEGMPGGWRGVARMREAMFRRLKGRVLVEASEWGYHSWPFHSRIGAYDYPNWGLKRFTDVHCADNEAYRAGTLLTAQLGWWAILGPSGDAPAEFPDEVEYLCGKSLAMDAPMSFQGIDVGGQTPNARQNEYLDMIGRYERLRLARAVPEAVRARLRAPREEFRLVPAAGGKWQFVPADYATHKVSGLTDGAAAWTVRNRFGPQPMRLRIEALEAAVPYDSADAVVLARFDKPDDLAVGGAAAGVTPSWAPAAEPARPGGPSAKFTAASTLKAREGAWAKIVRTFSPPVDLGTCGALGVWIHGDGKGELLNLQLTNPDRFWPTWDEHYVDVDFTGWRYVELHLRERDADRFVDYRWPYGGTSAVFRSPLIRAHTSVLAIYYNHLPPGDTATCYLSPVKALRTVKIRLADPAVAVGGSRIVFPVTLESGQYVEMESASDCRLYDARGALLRKVVPQGEPPRLEAGENRATFSCQGPEGSVARARVTVITQGDPLGPPLAP
jgi:hypothetical protein